VKSIAAIVMSKQSRITSRAGSPQVHEKDKRAYNAGPEKEAGVSEDRDADF
jgi:hypothetical protein